MPLLNTAKAAYRGSTPVKAIYRGAVKVWSSVQPLSSFTDDFSGGMTKWAGGQSGFTTTSGRAEATVPGTAMYNWARTADAGAENLIAADTTLIFQMGCFPFLDGREQQLGIYRGEQGSGRSGLMILMNGDYALVRGYDNDAFTNYGDSGGLPSTLWWRVVFTATTVAVSWSADGLTGWTQIATGAWVPGTNPVRLELAVGAWQAAGTFTGWFDNINVTPPAILGVEQGYGTQTKNAAFPFSITLTGDVYLFHYRNQLLGTPTAVDLQQVGSLDSTGRMSVWKVTGPAPSLTASGNNAAVNWTAVKVSKGAATSGAVAYQASNTTPAVPPPTGSGAAPVLVCYACNNNAVWTVPAGAQEAYRDTHLEARPSTMTVYYPAGPPVDADRGLSGTSRIEGSGAVWW